MAKQNNNTTDNISYEIDKQQAIELLKAGKKIQHKYFLSHEYIQLKNGQVIDEQGSVSGTIPEFFDMLNTAFHNGWTIFKQPQE